MKPTIPWLVGLASLLSPAAGQDDARPSRDPHALLKELQTEQRQLMQSWQAKMQQAQKEAAAAKAAGTPVPAMPARPDLSELRGKYLAAAAQFTGEDAVRFLMPVLNMGNKPGEYKEVLDILLTNHIDSPQLRQLGRMLGYLDQMVDAAYATTARKKIATQSKDPVLLGWLTLAENEKALRSSGPASEAFASAKAALLAASDKAADQQLSRQVKSLIDEQEKFGIGLQAPDIEGVDLDGVAFKLSDYRGKVVFLDFWGDW